MEKINKNRGGKPYNFKTLEINDFFVINCLKRDANLKANRVRSAAQMYRMRKKVDASFTVKKIIGGLQVTRIR